MTDITLDNGGTKLAASICGPPDADAILFLHGLSSSRDTWEEIAQSLSSDYLVWALDFRGHGHNCHPTRDVARRVPVKHHGKIAPRNDPDDASWLVL